MSFSLFTGRCTQCGMAASERPAIFPLKKCSNSSMTCSFTHLNHKVINSLCDRKYGRLECLVGVPTFPKVYDIIHMKYCSYIHIKYDTLIKEVG